MKHTKKFVLLLCVATSFSCACYSMNKRKNGGVPIIDSAWSGCSVTESPRKKASKTPTNVPNLRNRIKNFISSFGDDFVKNLTQENFPFAE